MNSRIKTTLRFGWTTGTCATAAAAAAYQAMLTGAFPEKMRVETPSGKVADLAITYTDSDGVAYTAGVIKDAGDDPDVTHGAEIRATITENKTGAGIAFIGGAGVGQVTRAGLPIAVGEPAINPVPRQMMHDAISNLAAELGGSTDITITISVPKGAELAQKTWNPRLGIEGGISILGTSGVVRPFSCSAWIASIHQGIDVAVAGNFTHIAGATGSTSESAVKARYELPDVALIDMGDFVGGMLKYLRRHPLPRVSVAGGFGKMIKLAQGAIDLHSQRSQIDFSALAALAAELDLPETAITNANTALEVLEILGAKKQHILTEAIAAAALKTCRQVLGKSAVRLGVVLVNRNGDIIAEKDET